MLKNIVARLAFSAAALLSFAICLRSEAGILYAVSGAGNSPSSLYQVNTSTGAATLVGATGTSHVTGLAFNPLTGDLYGHRSDIFDSGDSQLLQINVNTGASTLIGTTGIQVPDMAFSSNGTLYAWGEFEPTFSFSDNLYTIDTSTAVATLVGFSNIGTSNTGLAFDQNGALWVKSGDQLYSVNAVTGVGTFDKTLSENPNNALAFDENNTAYSVLRSDGNSFLVSVDLSTGVVTTIGDMGVSGISALAFAPVAANVPEPASMAIWGIGALGCAIAGYRRRKVA